MNYKTTWNEKYRPTRLSHVVGQNMTLFENIKKTNQMTNLIIYGKAGVGKTSAIIALAYELYKEKVEDAILEVNASENRGIEIVREKILQFSKLITPTETPNFKIIILDEADALTNECQNDLRRVIEEAINTRFFFICNNVHKIIEPLKSRCVMIKFKQIKPEFCIKTLMEISGFDLTNKNNQCAVLASTTAPKIFDLIKDDYRVQEAAVKFQQTNLINKNIADIFIF